MTEDEGLHGMSPGKNVMITCEMFNVLTRLPSLSTTKGESKLEISCRAPGGGTSILGHTRDVRPEWVSFPGRKPEDGCKFFTKSVRMYHNFDIILPENGWFSFKLNKTYCCLVNFYCK